MVNRIWPTAVAGKADSVSSVSASACHIGGPNSVNPGQILLVYGNLQLRIEVLLNIHFHTFSQKTQRTAYNFQATYSSVEL